MSKIYQTDPYLPFYTLEKSLNPKKKLYRMQVRRRDLNDIDRLLEISKGHRETVSTQADWEVLDEVLKFFVNRWPHEFKDFRDAMPQIRATRNRGGYSKNKETMYLGALPPRFERLIKTMFPLQQMGNKEFMYKLVNRYSKLFKVGGEDN